MKRELNITTRLVNMSGLKSMIQPREMINYRVVHQGESQSDYFFVEQANRMAAYIVERSIVGGEECSKPKGLRWLPLISH